MDNDYLDYRHNIKNGDLLAWSHRGWKSIHDIKVQFVRMFTRSEYSHLGTAWWSGGRLWVIESVEPCARVFPLSKLKSFYHTPLNALWDNKIEEATLSYVGAEYKQLHAIKAFLKPLAEGDVSQCAALVIQIAKLCGIDLGNRATPDAVMRQAQLYGNPTIYVKN